MRSFPFGRFSLERREENEKSLIYEDEEKYVVDEVPFKIMEDSCKYLVVLIMVEKKVLEIYWVQSIRYLLLLKIVII